MEDTAFDRWFVGRTPSRKATEADCAHACSNESSVHNTWCKSYHFASAPAGGKGSTCKLFDDCKATASKDAEQTQRETARLSSLYEKATNHLSNPYPNPNPNSNPKPKPKPNPNPDPNPDPP